MLDIPKCHGKYLIHIILKVIIYTNITKENKSDILNKLLVIKNDIFLTKQLCPLANARLHVCFHV
jgi:hypothetical protein